MTDDDFELVSGSGNVFRDLDLPNPEIAQLKAILAAKIISLLDEKKLSVRKAQDVTGIAAADFSRLRNARLSRFTIDRLMTILNKFEQDIEVTVQVRERGKRAPDPMLHLV
jgi:predicted XRE-type DNA-binding protein